MKNNTLQTINAAWGLTRKIIISKKSYWQNCCSNLSKLHPHPTTTTI